MDQITHANQPEMITKTQLIATRDSSHTPASYQPVRSVEEWARHACAGNGFGDAGIEPHTSRTETPDYA
jgi:hypothetical protein